MKSSKNIYTKLVLAAFFWGGSAIAAKLLLKEVSPSIATFARFFCAAIILTLVFAVPIIKTRIDFKSHIKLFILSITGITLCYYFYFKGLSLSSPFNAALIEATIPLITLLISVMLRKEHFKLTQFTGFIIAYLGIIIIITQLNLKIILTLNFNIGDILLLISTVCFGIYNVLYRDFKINAPTTLQTYYIMLYGTVGLIPWLLSDFYLQPSGQISQISISFIGIVCILFLSLGSSVLAYLFFNEGIEILGASKASGFINYVPIITIILSLSILREIPTYSQIIGAIVVLAGIYISQKKPNPNLKVQNGDLASS